MSFAGSHPAVFAGLLGSTTQPVKLALTLPIGSVADAMSKSLLLQFAVGCAIGAAVAGIVVFVGERLSRKDDIVFPGTHDDRWSSSSLNLMKAREEEADNEPTGDLGRYRTGQITIDLAALADVPQPVESRRPRHSAHLAPAASTAAAAAPSARGGRHFAAPKTVSSQPAKRVAPQAAAVPARGRHFAGATKQVSTRGAVSSTPVRSVATPTPSQRVVSPVIGSAAPVAARQAVPSSTSQARERLFALPTISSRYERVARVPAMTVDPSAVPAMPETVSARYTQRKAAERQAAVQTSAGITGRIRLRVREVLADRLGGEALDGVPIIQRADGTVSQVEPTWFDQNVVPKLASITGVTGKLTDTAEREPLAGRQAQKLPSEAAMSGVARASYISKHVAEVNVGMFPERRSASDLEHNDEWDMAIAAMNETIAQVSPTPFRDVVGGPSTIDDPDGLEAPTGFIPFRVPAAHPEVVDMETYVDYLLRDELTQNGSTVLRQSPHAHLRVIEGGTGNLGTTGKLRQRRRTGETGNITGRHFAPSYVREAL